GLYGGGLDPVEQVLGLDDPFLAAARLRAEENRRIHEIRQIVIASVNNRPVKIDHIVEGGHLLPGDPVGVQGIVVGHQTRPGRVSLSKPVEGQEAGGIYRVPDPTLRRAWRDEDDKVQSIVLLRKGEDSPPALEDVKKKVAELNDPESGRMLPG